MKKALLRSALTFVMIIQSSSRVAQNQTYLDSFGFGARKGNDLGKGHNRNLVDFDEEAAMQDLHTDFQAAVKLAEIGMKRANDILCEMQKYHPSSYDRYKRSLDRKKSKKKEEEGTMVKEEPAEPARVKGGKKASGGGSDKIPPAKIDKMIDLMNSLNQQFAKMISNWDKLAANGGGGGGDDKSSEKKDSDSTTGKSDSAEKKKPKKGKDSKNKGKDSKDGMDVEVNLDPKKEKNRGSKSGKTAKKGKGGGGGDEGKASKDGGAKAAAKDGDGAKESAKGGKDDAKNAQSNDYEEEGDEI